MRTGKLNFSLLAYSLGPVFFLFACNWTVTDKDSCVTSFWIIFDLHFDIFFKKNISYRKIRIKTCSLLGPSLDEPISALCNTAYNFCKQGYPYCILGMLAVWLDWVHPVLLPVFLPLNFSTWIWESKYSIWVPAQLV